MRRDTFFNQIICLTNNIKIMAKKLTPEDKLMKAIWGTKYKTEAELEKEIFDVIDESYNKQTGLEIHIPKPE